MKQTILITILSLLIFTKCSDNKEEYKSIALPEGIHRIIVKKHMNAVGYTYIFADDNGKEQWLAILEMPVQDGDTLYYSDAIEMRNFKSKTLDRTFESIMFVNSVSKTMDNSKGIPDKNEVHGKIKAKKNIDVNIEPLKDGKTVASLIKNRKELKDKKVKVRGVVTKYNPDILDKNWIHIKDGTNYKNEGDILVTSKDKVRIGDTVFVEGTLVIDKDFGAGYFYKVLIENATVTVE